MSLDAMSWVMNRAPVNNQGELAVLYALADRAHDDGTAAWPSQAWIAYRARCTDRTVRNHLNALERRGLIIRGDQELVSHLPSDRRPVVWDLNMGMEREDKEPEKVSFKRRGQSANTGGKSFRAENDDHYDRKAATNTTGNPFPTNHPYKPSLEEGGEVEGLVTGAAAPGSPSPESSPPPPPASAGATPDTWCTSEHPRCREHAHIPAGDEVPSCGRCGNVRRWFEDRAALVVDTKRRAIEDCPNCDDRGFIETTDTTGRPVAAVCDHERAPQPVDGPEVHRPVSDASTRRRMIEELRRAR